MIMRGSAPGGAKLGGGEGVALGGGGQRNDEDEGGGILALIPCCLVRHCMYRMTECTGMHAETQNIKALHTINGCTEVPAAGCNHGRPWTRRCLVRLGVGMMWCVCGSARLKVWGPCQSTPVEGEGTGQGRDDQGTADPARAGIRVGLIGPDSPTRDFHRSPSPSACKPALNNGHRKEISATRWAPLLCASTLECE